MAIIPIYRLRATSAGDQRRFRFSREPTPDPNPHPGQHDEDGDTKWIAEGVAFYAWSDQLEGEEKKPDLRPVYEFHRYAGGHHQYYYSMEPGAPNGWHKRPYVAFWAHAEDVEVGAPAVYRFTQDGSKRENFALAVDDHIEGWHREETPAFYASERVPVQVSVREHWKNPSDYDWTFTPSTVNLAYGSTLEFLPAPQSNFSFTGFEVVNGSGDFEPPDVAGDRVRLKARCTSRGKDYKYNVTVRISGTQREISGDPEIVNQDPTAL